MMIKHLKMAVVTFPELNVRPGQLHKLRGYFSEQFKQFDLIHNHHAEDNTLFYRYPAIQFKKAEAFSVFAYMEPAIEVLKEVFLNSSEVRIEGRVFPVRELKMDVWDVEFGEDGQFYDYSFRSPWLALNQDNYRVYRDLDMESKKVSMLRGALVNNIISFCKFAGYTVTEQLVVAPRVQQVQANLKGNTHIGFKGEFRVNFLLPDYLGLGKSSSRGYGVVVRRK